MKSGFATIIGRSNVGKSTLLNAIVGTKLAITSPKPQTTRHQLQGVYHSDEGQIVFVDTPGIFSGSKRQLTTFLNRAAESALNDIDVVVHVVDPTRELGPEDKNILNLLRDIKCPKVLVINKMDQHAPRYLPSFEALAEEESYDAVVKLSARTGQHKQSLLNTILEKLPEGEPMYPAGQITNLDNYFWIAEIIREKLFLRLQEEVPYSLNVKVDETEDRPDGTLYIKARVITSDDRYKPMIIGKGGRGIREIGQSSRKELEGAMGRKIFLDLNVEVDPHWTDEFKQ